MVTEVGGLDCGGFQVVALDGDKLGYLRVEVHGGVHVIVRIEADGAGMVRALARAGVKEAKKRRIGNVRAVVEGRKVKEFLRKMGFEFESVVMVWRAR